MKLFVTGYHGQVASMLKLFISRDHDVLMPTHADCDITKFAAVKQMITAFKPDVVINTAAYTKVDQAETEPELAFAVNRDGAKHLAMVCETLGCLLIHLSTDYVFNGNQNEPYVETDPVDPLNVYGLSKWEGEEAIRHYCERHLIIRVSAIFGTHGTNFVKTILRLAQEPEPLRIVTDQITCPTSAASIAHTLLQLLSPSVFGTYHYAGTAPVSWFQFAERIIAEGHLKKACLPIITHDYPTPAKRPLYSVLNCHKIEETFGIKRPDWEIGLKDVINALPTA